MHAARRRRVVVSPYLLLPPILFTRELNNIDCFTTFSRTLLPFCVQVEQPMYAVHLLGGA